MNKLTAFAEFGHNLLAQGIMEYDEFIELIKNPAWSIPNFEIGYWVNCLNCGEDLIK